MGEPFPLRNPLGTRGSACLEVMTTLHGSTLSHWRHAEGCVLPNGTIASARDPLTHPFYLIEPLQPCRLAQTQFGFHSYMWVHLWTFRDVLVTIGFSYPLRGLLLVCLEIGTCLSFSWATFLHCDQCVSTSSELPSCHFSFHVFVPYKNVTRFSLDLIFYIRVGDRSVKVSKQSGMDPQHDTVDRLTVTMTLFRMHQQV